MSIAVKIILESGHKFTVIDYGDGDIGVIGDEDTHKCVDVVLNADGWRKLLGTIETVIRHIEYGSQEKLGYGRSQETTVAQSRVYCGSPRSMDSAPRDGSKVVAWAADDDGYWGWRFVKYNNVLGWIMAGNHRTLIRDPKCWMQLPGRPPAEFDMEESQ